MRLTNKNFPDLRYPALPDSKYWDSKNRRELKMHKIHVYPAKFPSFLISKSIRYAEKKGTQVNAIGDIFCGCGTTALEAKKNGKTFWGWDINPVATLITKVKTQKYNEIRLKNSFSLILENYSKSKFKTPIKLLTNERINFWFEKDQVERLYVLKRSIFNVVEEGKYRDFFLVAFSNILKGASRWLTKSIKPTIDKNKKIKNIESLFKAQFKVMCQAVAESKSVIKGSTKARIYTQNFLKKRSQAPLLDLLITSPPYVTSYEYADLHQLSILWLDYARDYREFRNGTIGSLFHQTISESLLVNEINPIGKKIYDDLVSAGKSKAKSVAKYFIDLKLAIFKSYNLIKDDGIAIFVIGNTIYKDVYVDNAKYATACMFECGYKEVEVFKRRISSKILSPYRDQNGKFSNDKRKRKVYGHEFILIGKK